MWRSSSQTHREEKVLLIRAFVRDLQQVLIRECDARILGLAALPAAGHVRVAVQARCDTERMRVSLTGSCSCETRTTQ